MTIPGEIADRTLDYLHNDSPSLLACSLSSKLLLPTARYHLYSTLHLYPSRYTKLSTTLKDSPEVARIVEDLTFHCPHNIRDTDECILIGVLLQTRLDFLKRFSLLRHGKENEMNGVDWDVIVPRALQNAIYQLSSCRLSKPSISLKICGTFPHLSLFSNCSSLTDLTILPLDGVCCYRYTPDTFVRPVLRNLTMHTRAWLWKDSRSIPFDVRQLQSLTLFGDSSMFIETRMWVVKEVTHLCAESLETLGWWYEYQHHPDATPDASLYQTSIPLSKCIHLKRLLFGTHKIARPDIMATILESSCPTLQILEIVVPNLHSDGWQDLDDCLMEGRKRFPSLRKIVLYVVPPSTRPLDCTPRDTQRTCREWAARQLPNLSNLGLLEVVPTDTSDFWGYVEMLKQGIQ